MRLRLTDVTVRGLAPSAGQVKVWDTVTKGFGVRVNGASKSWFVMYGKSRKLKVLGHYPATSLADARRSAKEILLSPEERPQFIRFKEATVRFIETQDHLSKRSIGDYSRLLKVHFEPMFASKPLNEISTKEISDILDRLSDRPGERKYAHSVIRRFFKWAVARRLLDRSPVEGMEAPKPVASRDRVLTDAELKAIWEAAGSCGQFGTIVKLLMLTGQRANEIARLQTSWIKENQIDFPKEATKNRAGHTFPVGTLSASIIATCGTKSEYLFPAKTSRSSPFNGFSKSKLALDKKLSPDFEDWVLHDLRRTFATNLAKLGTPIHVTERLLNHKTGTVSGIVAVYQRHDFQKEMREAIEIWEQKLASIVGYEAPRNTTP